MLKKSFILIGLIFTASLSQAQIKPRFFEFGPKAGINVTGLATLDTISFNKKIAFNYQAGVFTRFNMGKFSLQPEFIYQTKGGATTIENISSKYAYKYLSTPVLVGVTPLKGIYLETGMEYSWTLNQKSKKGQANIYGPDVKNDKSWIVGARINMLDAFSLFSLNLRYTHGLTNQMPDSKQKITPLDFRNRSAQVSVTYTFSEYWRWKRKYGVKKK